MNSWSASPDNTVNQSLNHKSHDETLQYLTSVNMLGWPNTYRDTLSCKKHTKTRTSNPSRLGLNSCGNQNRSASQYKFKAIIIEWHMEPESKHMTHIHIQHPYLYVYSIYALHFLSFREKISVMLVRIVFQRLHHVLVKALLSRSPYRTVEELNHTLMLLKHPLLRGACNEI